MKPFLFTLCVFAFFSCQKTAIEDACSSDNPLEEIDWLKEFKREFDQNGENSREQIVQYDYKGERVFLINPCYQCPDAMTFVYDCEENTICIFDNIGGFDSCPNFSREATQETILYDR